RYFIFFGFLLIINLAFLYEHQLINKKLLLIFLLCSIGYLFFANYYNDLPDIYSANFHYTEEVITRAQLIVYIISFFVLLLFIKKRWTFSFILLAEKVALMVLIIGLTMGSSYTQGVRRHATYGRIMND